MKSKLLSIFIFAGLLSSSLLAQQEMRGNLTIVPLAGDELTELPSGEGEGVSKDYGYSDAKSLEKEKRLSKYINDCMGLLSPIFFFLAEGLNMPHSLDRNEYRRIQEYRKPLAISNLFAVIHFLYSHLLLFDLVDDEEPNYTDIDNQLNELVSTFYSGSVFLASLAYSLHNSYNLARPDLNIGMYKYPSTLDLGRSFLASLVLSYSLNVAYSFIRDGLVSGSNNIILSYFSSEDSNQFDIDQDRSESQTLTYTPALINMALIVFTVKYVVPMIYREFGFVYEEAYRDYRPVTPGNLGRGIKGAREIEN